jgi:UDP-N-acetylmuramoyl-tripeptide--D-alanyl-D-alanine ligase
MKRSESLYAVYRDHPVISTDTRKIVPGCIFFALKGANFDGNTFARQALDAGAAFAVVSDPTIKGPDIIYAEDTLQALQDLAHEHRGHLDIPVLGITGSNGKTTTKELIAAVLAKKYSVHATSGNLNNHIGVPLTILSTSTDTEFIICEMGANHAGEIARLCEIAAPTHGLITNIGKAHLEGFGSLDGVKKAKGELYEYVSKHSGISFVNTDDPRLLELSQSLEKKITYGFHPASNPDFLFEMISTPDENGIRIKDTASHLEIESKLYGHYNAINMLAAYTVGHHFNVPQEKILDALSGFVSGSNRSEVVEFKGCTIIKDAYNANPSSMEQAIKSFHARHAGGWVVLGDMKEGGTETLQAHRDILNDVMSLSFEKIWLVGEHFSDALASVTHKDTRIFSVPDIHALKSIWPWDECQGKSILLKGSRSMQLEKLLE